MKQSVATVVVLLVGAVTARGQAPVGNFSEQSVPKSSHVAKALHQLNLQSESNRAFHLDATFDEKLWDGSGLSGKIAVDWLSPKWFRSSVTTPTGTYVMGMVDGRTYASRDARPTHAETLFLIAGTFTFPNRFEAQEPEDHPVALNGMQLHCFKYSGAIPPSWRVSAPKQTFCVDQTNDDLKLVQDDMGFRAVYSDPQAFGKRYRIPKTIVLARPSGVFGTLKGVTVREAPELKKADLAAPAGTELATTDDKKRDADEQAKENFLQKFEPTNFPGKVFRMDTASQHKTALIVRVDVSEAGKVQDATLLSAGDAAVSKKVMEIAKQLQFPPPAVGGKPMSVATTLLFEP